MTTAWAHLVRGQVAQAVAVHLAGTLAALAAVVATPWLLVSAILGRWALLQPRGQTLLLAATLWLVVAVLDWVRRIVFY